MVKVMKPVSETGDGYGRTLNKLATLNFPIYNYLYASEQVYNYHFLKSSNQISFKFVAAMTRVE
jgi:hypothetical protein